MHTYIPNSSQVPSCESISSTLTLVQSAITFHQGHSSSLPTLLHLLGPPPIHFPPCNQRKCSKSANLIISLCFKPLKPSSCSQDQAKHLCRGTTPPGPFSCSPPALSLHSGDPSLLAASWDPYVLSRCTDFCTHSFISLEFSSFLSLSLRCFPSPPWLSQTFLWSLLTLGTSLLKFLLQ